MFRLGRLEYTFIQRGGLLVINNYDFPNSSINPLLLYEYRHPYTTTVFYEQ